MDLPRATEVVSGDAAKETDDEIWLDFDARHRRRIRMTSQSGREFLLDLPKAEALGDGQALVLDDGTKIGIRAQVEAVADITADDAHQLTRIAWHLGNRHWPTQILEDGLRIRYDHVLVDMVRGLGGTVTERDAPFQPEGGAYGHGHGHEH